MKEIVLITNSNIGSTAGDTTLILRRASALFDEGFHTTILLFHAVKQGNANKGDKYYSIELCNSKKALKEHIVTLLPSYIILCGNRIQMMTCELRAFLNNNQMRTKIVLDIQGAVEESEEYSSNFLRKRFLYPLISSSFSKALQYSDGAFVVSDELIENSERRRKNSSNEYHYYKVRCGISYIPNAEEIIATRTQKRIELGLADDTVVFSYSGYRMPWQKIDEIIQQFMCFDEKMDNAYFMFFCNTDELFESKLHSCFPKGNYTVKLLGKEEYCQMLIACDVGYILRDYNETNRVAFPNKFSDYVSAGLLLAINGALPEPMRVLRNNDIPYIDSEKTDFITAMKLIEERRRNYQNYIEKALLVCENELLYSTQIKKYFGDF